MIFDKGNCRAATIVTMNYASASAGLRGTYDLSAQFGPRLFRRCNSLARFSQFALSEWESAQFLNFIALQQIFKNRADFEQPSHFLMKSGLIGQTNGSATPWRDFKTMNSLSRTSSVTWFATSQKSAGLQVRKSAVCKSASLQSASLQVCKSASLQSASVAHRVTAITTLFKAVKPHWSNDRKRARKSQPHACADVFQLCLQPCKPGS